MGPARPSTPIWNSVKSTPASFRQAASSSSIARDAFGEDAVVYPGPSYLGSEDFAFMLQACRGAYLWLGQGNGEGHVPLHHPKYDFNDGVLGNGIRLHGGNEASGFRDVVINDCALHDNQDAGLVAEAFASVRNPGRFEVVRHEPLLVLDGAHNPDGARAAAATLAGWDRAALERFRVLGIGEISRAKLIRDHAGLHERMIEQIARQSEEPGFVLQRRGKRLDDLAIRAFAAGDILGQRAAGDVRRSAEVRLPEAIAEDDDPLAARRIRDHAIWVRERPAISLLSAERAAAVSTA